MFPSNVATPNASTIDFSGNDAAVANGAIVALGASVPDLAVRTVFFGGIGTVHLILDVYGYFQPGL